LVSFFTLVTSLVYALWLLKHEMPTAEVIKHDDLARTDDKNNRGLFQGTNTEPTCTCWRKPRNPISLFGACTGYRQAPYLLTPWCRIFL